MKDDSARDKAIDKLLARKLNARLHDEGRPCPDAETIAAYVERTLSSSEHQTLETHLVACRFCQDQVAELVRMNESDEIEEAMKPVPAKPRVAWFRWAMAAPALVALLVAGLWYTGEFQPFLRQEGPATVEGPQPPAPSPVTQPRSKDTAAKSPVGGESLEAANRKPETPKESEALKSGPRMSIYGSTGSSVEVKPGAGGGVGSGVGRASNEAASETSDELRAVAQAGGTTAAPQDVDRTASRRYRAPAAPSAEPPQNPGSALALHDKEPSEEFAREDTAATKRARIQSQSEAPTRLEKGGDSGVEFHGFIQDRRTWRVGRQGLIQKAAPDGSWEIRPSGVKADLFGISFANPRVGWAVGQDGTVLRTADGGATWTRMPSPTSEDLVRVGAISETKINVITRSGQTLQSSDGGKTWSPLG